VSVKAVGDAAIRGGSPHHQPEHVAIVGLGPSAAQYENIVKRLGARKRFADELWVINGLGDVLRADRVWHMDDVRVQELRAKERPDSNIAAMLGWMRTYQGPIYTSFAHPDYPALVEFPLEAVANSTGYAYFNSTAAYAVAYAVHIGVKKLSVFGFDFTYPNAHHAEKGRACVEFWLGMAAARGIKIAVPRESSLLDACHPYAERLYGYDAVAVTITDKPGGGFAFAFAEKALPSAAEVELAYDHEAHPNALMRG